MEQKISSYKTKDGLYGLAVSLGTDENGKRIRIARTGTTEEQAAAALAKALEKHNSKYGFKPVESLGTGLTVKEAVNDYIRATVLKNVSSRTSALYIYIMSLFTNVYGEWDIRAIHWEQLESLYEKLENAISEDGTYRYGESTLIKFGRHMKKFFRRAYALGLIQSDPTQHYDYHSPKSNAVTKEVKAFRDEHIKAILEALKDYPALLIPFKVELSLGLRTEEVLALKWKNLHRDEGYISVEQSITLDYDIDRETMKIGRAKTVLGNTKTACSVREIPIDDDIFVMIENWKAYAAKNTKTRFGKNDFVFGNTQYTHWSYSGFRNSVNDALEEKGLDRIRLHRNRHTAATLAIRNGASPIELQTFLGHKKLSTTEGYITRNSDMAKKASGAVSKGLSDILEKKE